jgi:putative peptidoglycan lipid II flippase
MVWWSISLPFQGVSLLFSRTFFGLQQPWATTGLAVINMVVNAAVAFALYKPFGIAGIVIGTVAGTLVMTVAQGWILRGELAGIDGVRTLSAAIRMLAAAAVLGGVSYAVWHTLDAALGTALPAQVASVGLGILTGVGAYVAAVALLRIGEGRQLAQMFARRGG